MRAADKLRLLILLTAALVSGAACNRMVTPPRVQLIKDADARVQSGDLLVAINLYECALDGSPGSADIHYRLAMLYDEKMKDPLNAMHHFKRYLTVAPSGPRVEEVKNYMKQNELALLTDLSGDTVVSRGEAARLRNENLSLRQQLEDKRLAELRTAAANKETEARSGGGKNSSREKRTSRR